MPPILSVWFSPNATDLRRTNRPRILSQLSEDRRHGFGMNGPVLTPAEVSFFSTAAIPANLQHKATPLADIVSPELVRGASVHALHPRFPVRRPWPARRLVRVSRPRDRP